MPEYTIRELADEFGLSLKTLRFYGDRGLLSPRMEQYQRVYSERDRQRVKRIVEAKRLGFTVRQIQELLDTGSELHLSLEVIDRQIRYVEERMAELSSSLQELRRLRAELTRDARLPQS